MSHPTALCLESRQVYDLPGLMLPSLLVWAALLGSGHSAVQPLGSWRGFLGDEPRPDPGEDQGLLVRGVEGDQPALHVAHGQGNCPRRRKTEGGGHLAGPGAGEACLLLSG